MFTSRPKNGHGLNSNGKPSTNGNGHSALSAASYPVHKNGNGKTNGNGHSNGGHAAKSGPVETVLGPGVHYKGALNGAAGVRIEGTFDGTINIQGAVVIADGAKVTADIHAGAVSVGGSVKGNITAGKVEILATGRVWGDLVTAAFASEEGAFLRGTVRMEDNISPASLPPPALPVTEPKFA